MTEKGLQTISQRLFNPTFEKGVQQAGGIVPLLLLVCSEPSIAVIVISLLGPSSTPQVCPYLQTSVCSERGGKIDNPERQAQCLSHVLDNSY